MKLDKPAIFNRLEQIEMELESAGRAYERYARSSQEHTRAWARVHNLESERACLEGFYVSTKL
jgi:hypothetical protein